MVKMNFASAMYAAKILFNTSLSSIKEVLTTRPDAVLGKTAHDRAQTQANLAEIAGKSGAMFLRSNMSAFMSPQMVIDLSSKAALITAKGFERVRETIKPGMTEIEVAAIFNKAATDNGAAGLAFSTLVLTGPHAALVFSNSGAHIQPSQRKIKAGELVLIDAGASVKWGKKSGDLLIGSDVTRTIAMGQISALQKKIYETVLQAQLAAIAGIKAGARSGDVDALARKIIEQAEFPTFWHATGHGIGLADQDNLHSLPLIRAFVISTLKEGQVVTVEPGIYLGLEGENENNIIEVDIQGVRFAGGLRIEDTMQVTKEGVLVFTDMIPKDLESNTIPLSIQV